MKYLFESYQDFLNEGLFSKTPDIEDSHGVAKELAEIMKQAGMTKAEASGVGNKGSKHYIGIWDNGAVIGPFDYEWEITVDKKGNVTVDRPLPKKQKIGNINDKAKLVKAFMELFNYVQESVTESAEGWVDAQMAGDAGGLHAGNRVMVHKATFESTEPNKDVQVRHSKKGYVDVPRSFVQLSEDTGNGVIHEGIKTYGEFINESINLRVRAKIVVALKKAGFENGEDYVFSAGEFIAPDLQTAQDMADALGNKYRVAIYDKRKTKDGKVPMMIVK